MASNRTLFDMRTTLSGLFLDVVAVERITDFRSRIHAKVDGLHSANSRQAREILKDKRIGLYVGLSRQQVESIRDFRTLFVDRALMDLSEVRDGAINNAFHAPILRGGFYAPTKDQMDTLRAAEEEKRKAAEEERAKTKAKPKFERPEERLLSARWNLFYLPEKVNCPLTAALAGHEINLLSYIPVSQMHENKTLEIPVVETTEATSLILAGQDHRPAKAVYGNPSFGDTCMQAVRDTARGANPPQAGAPTEAPRPDPA